MHTRHLRESRLTLLGEVASKSGVCLDLNVELGSSLKLTKDEKRGLIDVIANEFTECGLIDDYEPNKYGVELEDLLDAVNNIKSM